MALEGQMSGREPELAEGQLAFDGALDFWRWKRRQISGRVGRGLGFTAVDFGQDRFPFGYPAATGLALSALAVNHGGVEEPWSEASQAAMGAQGAGERDEGGPEVIGRAREGPEGDASPASDGGAHRSPARMT